MTRKDLERFVPAWAVVSDTGRPEAPHAAVWRVGAAVYVACLADTDAAGLLGQLADSVGSREEPEASGSLAVRAMLFPSEAEAGRYMRDLRRLHRASVQSDRKREAQPEIPV